MDGAKFALCLREATQESVRELHEVLRRLASESLTVEGTPVSLSISGGAVFVKKFAGSDFPIISCAAYALDLSKRECHSELVFFDNELGRDTHRSIELLDTLRQDIVNGCHGFLHGLSAPGVAGGWPHLGNGSPAALEESRVW